MPSRERNAKPSIADRIGFSVYSALIERLWHHHPIYNSIGVGSCLNDLQQEFFDLPLKKRNEQLKRVLKRELLLWLTGQKGRQATHIPSPAVQRILWVYDWPTLGDGIMDLSQRFAFPTEFVECRCTMRFDLSSLVVAAQEIQCCTFFIGADGGLMHIAAALDKPGVALFAEIRPEWRLLPDSPLVSLYTEGAMADIPQTEIIAAFLAVVHQTVTPASSISYTA